MCWLLHSTSQQMSGAKQNGTNGFKARNDAQVYRARDLSRAFAEYYALQCFTIRINSPDTSAELRPVLQKIHLLYGLWCIDKHLGTFYHGNFTSGPAFADLIRGELLQRCKELKEDAVVIADSLAPPDWILNSVLGKSDGNVSFESFYFYDYYFWPSHNCWVLKFYGVLRKYVYLKGSLTNSGSRSRPRSNSRPNE